MTRLEATLELNGKRATAGAATLAGLAAQMDRERQLVPDHPMVVELSSGPAPGHAAAVASRLTELAAERDALSQREAEHRQAAKAQAAAAKRHEAALAAVAASEKTLSALQARHAAAVSAREAARETLQRAGGELANAQAALEPLFALLPAGARDAFERDAAAQIQVFNEDTQALRALDQQAGEAAQRAATTIVERDGAIQEEITAREVLAKRREEETAVRREHDTLRGERAGLLGGRAADAVERELRLALAQAGQRREVATAALNVAEKEGAAAAEAARAAETAVSEGAVRQEAARRALEEWLAAFAVRTSRSLDRAALRMLLARDENWFRAERAALDSLAAAVSTAEGVHQAGTHALADHAAVRPTAEDESSVMADLAQRQTARVEAERQHVAAAAEISADDRRRLECAALLEKLTAQQTRAEPWGKLNELIGSADGAKFRGIAQRRTLDLLLGFANAQLELLAARYRLERLPESLNLVVLDRDMADERRSVHSLSGGESFLVSLALALGLASLTSNRIRIESLFIDEGFGSLDSATLNTAMNALMQLEAQGRKVGVISHVTEMADAIPVQIRVVRGRAGAARLLVPGAEPNAEEGAAESGATAHGSDPDVDVAQLAERLLGILRREKTAGVSWVSSISLRRELGCEPRDFSAAREALGDQVLTQGKSMGLR
jgi:exonuclease SbcC